MNEPNDLKFTTAGQYMLEQQATKPVLPYFINEAGLKIDNNTGQLYQPQESGQCLPP
jgi:hypothetical protein